MTIYVVGALDKNDPDMYTREYVSRAGKSLEKYPGSRAAADDAPVLIEGELPGHRFILLKFANDAEFEQWYQSPEYQEAKKFREKSATIHFLVKIRGNY